MLASCSTRVVDRRRAGEVAAGLGLGDDAAGQRELGVAERVAGGVHVEPGLDVAVVPLEVRQVVGAVDVDQGQVVALRHAEDRGVVALVELAADVHLERRRAGDDVVVGDGEAVGADDEAAAEARAVGEADLGVAERALGDDLDDRRLDVVVAGDARPARRPPRSWRRRGRRRRGAVVGPAWSSRGLRGRGGGALRCRRRRRTHATSASGRASSSSSADSSGS